MTTRSSIEQLHRAALSGSVLARIERLAEMVADFYQVRLDVIRSRNRLDCVVWPRQVIMYLAQVDKIPTRVINEYFHCSHGTVAYAVQAVQTRCNQDKTRSAQVERLLMRLKRPPMSEDRRALELAAI